MRKITLLNRYDKDIIEEFAINTISKSFSDVYSNYKAPKNPDNFDFLSQDGNSALEVTLILPENEKKEYEYEKAKSKNRKANARRIIDVNFDNHGNILSYYGGSISEIKKSIINSIKIKNQKATKRIIKKPYSQIDLCLVIQDGSLLDLDSFRLFFKEFYSLEFIFSNIFFITRSNFIRYSKISGFEEYERKLENM